MRKPSRSALFNESGIHFEKLCQATEIVDVREHFESNAKCIWEIYVRGFASFEMYSELLNRSSQMFLVKLNELKGD